MIHNSHSKKDLIQVVERFQLYQINDYKEIRKDKLAHRIWLVLKDLNYVPPEGDLFFVDDIRELREYLRKSSTKQITSNSVKYDVADRVKHLNFYVKGGCVFKGTNYDTVDDVMVDAEFVRHFGDLPSVRRVIEGLNNDVKTPFKLSCVMTRRVEQRIKQDQMINTQNTPKFHMTTGNYTVAFL